VAHTRIATIATDQHHELQEFRALVVAQWAFLSDPGSVSDRHDAALHDSGIWPSDDVGVFALIVEPP
jgi:hypothetical protein